MTRLEAKEDLNDNKREIGENGWIFIQKRCLFIDLKVTFRRNVFKILDTFLEGLLWTHIFHNTSPLDWRDSLLFKETLHFTKKKKTKVTTYFYLFNFKRGNQVRTKPLKWLLAFEKVIYEKLESGFGDYVTYWEGTSKEVASL